MVPLANWGVCVFPEATMKKQNKTCAVQTKQVWPASALGYRSESHVLVNWNLVTSIKQDFWKGF